MCDLVAGRVPLLIEIKSRFDGDSRLAARTAAVLAGYRGPVAAMSFDPEPMRPLREIAPALARGLVGMRREPAPRPPNLGRDALRPAIARRLSAVPGLSACDDLTDAPPLLARHLLGLPLLTWTVRTPPNAPAPPGMPTR